VDDLVDCVHAAAGMLPIRMDVPHAGGGLSFFNVNLN
jgi:hypothetical protein